jgi:hypothetical protein
MSSSSSWWVPNEEKEEDAEVTIAIESEQSQAPSFIASSTSTYSLSFLEMGCCESSLSDINNIELKAKQFVYTPEKESNLPSTPSTAGTTSTSSPPMSSDHSRLLGVLHFGSPDEKSKPNTFVEEAAATLLQSSVRGLQARREFKHQAGAVVILQQWARKRSVEKSLFEEQDQPTKTEEAIQIQMTTGDAPLATVSSPSELLHESEVLMKEPPNDETTIDTDSIGHTISPLTTATRLSTDGEIEDSVIVKESVMSSDDGQDDETMPNDEGNEVSPTATASDSPPIQDETDDKTSDELVAAPTDSAVDDITTEGAEDNPMSTTLSEIDSDEDIDDPLPVEDAVKAADEPPGQSKGATEGGDSAVEPDASEKPAVGLTAAAVVAAPSPEASNEDEVVAPTNVSDSETSVDETHNVEATEDAEINPATSTIADSSEEHIGEPVEEATPDATAAVVASSLEASDEEEVVTTTTTSDSGANVDEKINVEGGEDAELNPATATIADTSEEHTDPPSSESAEEGTTESTEAPTRAEGLPVSTTDTCSPDTAKPATATIADANEEQADQPTSESEDAATESSEATTTAEDLPVSTTDTSSPESDKPATGTIADANEVHTDSPSSESAELAATESTELNSTAAGLASNTTDPRTPDTAKSMKFSSDAKGITVDTANADPKAKATAFPKSPFQSLRTRWEVDSNPDQRWSAPKGHVFVPQGGAPNEELEKAQEQLDTQKRTHDVEKAALEKRTEELELQLKLLRTNLVETKKRLLKSEQKRLESEEARSDLAETVAERDAQIAATPVIMAPESPPRSSVAHSAATATQSQQQTLMEESGKMLEL